MNREFGTSRAVATLPARGLASAWAVRVRGDAGGSAGVRAAGGVVTLVDAASLLLSGRRLAVEQRRVLEAAREQRDLADGGGRHWAAVEEIHEGAMGEGDDTGYWRRAHYAWSAERLALVGYPVSSRQLRGLMIGVAQGLGELDEQLNRPWGNLESSTVLLRMGPGTERFGTMTADGSNVVLTDLRPRDGLFRGGLRTLTGLSHSATGATREAYEADMRALGRLVFELVVGRKPPARALLGPGWQAEVSPEWDRLPDGAWWRALANRLMNAGGVRSDGTGELYTHEMLLTDLISHEAARDPVRKDKVIAYTLAGVLMLGAGGTAAVMVTQRQTAQMAEAAARAAAYTKYLEDWLGWFGQLAAAGDELRALAAKYPEDTGLARLAEVMLRPGLTTPQDIAGKNADISALKDNPGAALSEGGAARTREMRERVSEATEALERWETPGVLRQVEPLWAARGWMRGAAACRALAVERDRLLRDVRGNDLQPARVLREICAAARAASAAERDWISIAAAAERLAGTSERVQPDDVLGRLEELALNEVKGVEEALASSAAPGEVVEAVREAIEPLAQACGQAARYGTGGVANWDGEAMRRGEVYLALAKKIGPDREVPRGEELRAWLKEAERREYLPPDAPDPRPEFARAWLPRVEQMQAGVDRLAAQRQQGAELSVEPAEERERLAGLEARRAGMERLGWSVANQGTIEAELKALNEAGEAQKQRIAEAIATAGLSTEQWIAQQPREPFASAALNRAWQTALAEAGGARKDKRSTHAMVDAAREWLTAVERGMAVELPKAPGPGLDAPALATALAREKEARIQDVVLGGVREQLRDVGRIRTAAGELQEWLKRAEAHAGAWVSVGTMLDEGDPRAETAGRALYDAPLAAALDAATAPVRARVEALGEARTLRDTDRLVALVKSERAAEAVMAWRRLADVDWPGDAGEMREAAALREGAVARVLERIGDEASRRAARESVDRAGRVMWLTFMAARGAGDAAGMDAAMKARGALGITPEAQQQLGPAARLNAVLWETRTELQAAAARDGATPGRDAIIAQQEIIKRRLAEAEPLTAAVRAATRPELSAGLAEWREVAARDAAALFDPTANGPGRLKARGGKPLWAAAVAADGSVTYTLSGAGGRAVRVEFRPVEVVNEETGATTKAYVSSAEVSVGVFIAVVEAAQNAGNANAWEQARLLLRMWAPTAADPRAGIAAWTWNASRERIVLGDRGAGAGWLVREPQMGDLAYYSPEIGEVSGPGADTPMTWVSAPGAQWLAELMGCRLPMEREWRAARRLKAATDEREKPLVENLRDRTWQAQHRYVSGLTPERKPWPAEGIFWPPPGRPLWPQDGRAPMYVRNLDDAALDMDDGWLWLRPVTAGSGGFADLIGNAAEWTLREEPKQLVATLLKARAEKAGADETGEAGAARADTRTVEDEIPKVFGIIGASALSGVKLRNNEAYNAEKLYDVTRVEALRGFSDVGFRLAFGESGPGRPKEAPAVLALRALEKMTYLGTRQ